MFLGYIEAIIGFKAASIIPLPIPTNRVAMKREVIEVASKVQIIPIACIINAIQVFFLIPKESTRDPPIIIARVNPQNAGVNAYPICSSVKPTPS